MHPSKISWRTKFLAVCFPLVFCSLFPLSALAQGVNEISSLPIITTHPQSSIVTLGTSVTLRCVAMNDNLPILFTHNGVMISEADPGFTIGVGSLTIRNLDENLEGEYNCLARNRVGNITFTVASAPAFVQLRVFTANLFSMDSSSPHNVTTTVGQPVVLSCASSYNSIPAPTFDWVIFTPFQRTLQDSDNAVIGINGSLYVQKPTTEQSGMVFQCRLTNGDRVKTGYVRLIVQASSSTPPPPQLLSHPMNVSITEGTNTVKFDCIVGGNPLVSISWTTPDQGPTTSILSNGNQLVAYGNLQSSHAGKFTCSVPSLRNYSASLSFIETPRLTSALPGTTLVLNYGRPLSLRCATDAKEISWYWFHNGLRLTQFTGRQLDIVSLVEEDTGSYQCYAVNEAGRVLSATYVKVRTIGADIQQELPAQQVVFSDHPVDFTCTAIGIPAPTYQWLKEGVPLSNVSGTFQINRTAGSLRIVNADTSLSGQYTCRASNRIDNRLIGQDETRTTLTVIIPTVFTKPPAGERMLSIQLGTNDTLFCEASSDSDSSIRFSWTRDGRPLNVDGTRLTYIDPTLSRNGNIQIRNVMNEDAGEYVCTVTTTYDGVAAPTIITPQIQVMVNERPVAPSIASVTSPSSTSVRVVWTITSNLDRLRMFNIEIRPSTMTMEDSWTKIIRNVNALTEVTIEEQLELTPFTSYDVRVSATYISGDVAMSDVEKVVTMEDLPGDPPQKVTTVTIPSSNSDIEINWQPPSQPNGIITNYTIQYRLKDSATPSIITTIVNATSYVLKSLKEGQTYSIRVAASNSVGMGPFSPERLAIPGKSTLIEPQGQFTQTVGFIVMVSVIVLVLLLVGFVLLVLVLRHKRKHRRSTGKYHVRPQSGYFGGGAIGDMTEDVANDYMKRSTEMNAFGSPTNSEALDAILEQETVATTLTDHSLPYPSSRGTPQLPNGTRYMGFSAPGYINPPSFAEATRSRSGSQSSRPHSAASNMDKPANMEWNVDHNLRTAYQYQDPFERKDRHYSSTGDDSGADSSYSVQTYSDVDSEATDATEYSHLAGAGQFPRTYNHLKVQATDYATLV